MIKCVIIVKWYGKQPADSTANRAQKHPTPECQHISVCKMKENQMSKNTEIIVHRTHNYIAYNFLECGYVMKNCIHPDSLFAVDAWAGDNYSYCYQPVQMCLPQRGK